MTIVHSLIASSCLILLANGEFIGRLIDGNSTSEHEFPFIASIRSGKEANYHFCSGSIINEHWILSAASCFTKRDKSNLVAVVGTNNSNDDGDIYRIEEVIIHEKYSYRYHDNIALARVDREIKFNEFVQSIQLATEDFVDYGSLGEFARFTARENGEISRKLQAVQLPIISNEKCKKSRSHYITDKHICTYHSSTVGLCYEDIGGPLIANGKQIALASYAIPCVAGWPDVYTRIFSYIDWIHRIVDN